VILPFPVGSGKFETPCDRMHAENWSARESATDGDLVWLAEEPQAAAMTAQPKPSTTVQIRA
jgi:hypothetical protein